MLEIATDLDLAGTCGCVYMCKLFYTCRYLSWSVYVYGFLKMPVALLWSQQLPSIMFLTLIANRIPLPSHPSGEYIVQDAALRLNRVRSLIQLRDRIRFAVETCSPSKMMRCVCYPVLFCRKERVLFVNYLQLCNCRVMSWSDMSVNVKASHISLLICTKSSFPGISC